MAGAGKFPYLSLDAPSVDFGEVLLGKSSEALVRFGNHSQVPAHFSVVHEVLPGAEKSSRLLGEPDVFTISPMRYCLGIALKKTCVAMLSRGSPEQALCGTLFTMHVRRPEICWASCVCQGHCSWYRFSHCSWDTAAGIVFRFSFF
jgi:hypothetical protein